MLKNYIKIAFRNLRRYKSHSFINIFGLAAGLASSLIIFLFVRYELTYDAFHKKADNIFLIQKHRSLSTGLQVLNDTWIPLLNQLKIDYPQVKDGVRLFTEDIWIENDGKKFKEEITFADPSLLNVFSFGLKNGNKSSALTNKHSLVLSQEIAQKYFGNNNPIGKTLRLGFDTDYIITGVLEEIPGNSSIPMSIVAPFESIIDPADKELNSDWGGAFLYTYILLSRESDKKNLESLLPQFVEKTWGKEGGNGSEMMKLKLLPLKDYHNFEFESRQFAYILICIAAAILLIASFNLMNLSTARSLERLKEIGIRKVLGAERKQLIRQFIGESLILTFIALIVGIAAAEFMLPSVNKLYNISLTLDIFSNPVTLLIITAGGLFVGTFSGSYPAFVLSRLPVVKSVKGNVSKEGSSAGFRKILITAQFALTIILIIGTSIIWQQTEYLKNHDPNFDKSGIVVLPVSYADFPDGKEAVNKIDAFKKELLNNSNISGVSTSMSVPGEVVNANVFVKPEGWNSDEPLRMRIAGIDEDFFGLYKVDFVEGRNFSLQMPTDKDESVILNEAAMTAMGWKSATGKTVTIGKPFKVVGVVKDYHTESLADKVTPLIHFYRTSESSSLRYISVKFEKAGLNTVIDYLRDKYSQLDPQREFEFFFIDEKFDTLYQSQDRMLSVVGYFSLTAIVIACLGLLGLASYNITQRTKEIGIRKVLGASTANIFLLISGNFMMLVFAALVIAWPSAYFLMNKWLEDFALRIEINFTPFLLSGLLIALLALTTISVKALKAASVNPVKSLKVE